MRCLPPILRPLRDNKAFLPNSTPGACARGFHLWNFYLGGALQTMRTSITLQFECPITGKSVSFDSDGSASSLRMRWSSLLTLHCEHCAVPHVFPFRRGYVDGALSNVGGSAGCAAMQFNVR